MPSVIRTILVALHATAFVALSGLSLSTTYAVASPLPAPLTRVIHDYKRVNVSTHRTSPSLKNSKSKRDPWAIVSYSSRRSVLAKAISARDRVLHPPTTLDPRLAKYYRGAVEHSQNLRKLAARSAPLKEGSTLRRDSAHPDIRNAAVVELSSFNQNMAGMQAILGANSADKRSADKRGADKGLANYDRTNDLETLLKDVVNLHKDTLKSVSILVYNIPILGPILGPIVYQLKCILDDLLDCVEDLTDAIINALQPLLRALIGTASTLACKSGVELLGLCI
ncbi:hypothetical protein Hypma_015509 [Hypsizygus marmoreus]|uniref:Uncharacterized protein n=1 Tax=Hypsizygus marmoreus TaxID=39966 RepID=A0A369K5J7_HYPMA|nr:hypothetical protein Hypma_015509 [Hypsizygus marmoreus]